MRISDIKINSKMRAGESDMKFIIVATVLLMGAAAVGAIMQSRPKAIIVNTPPVNQISIPATPTPQPTSSIPQDNSQKQGIFDLIVVPTDTPGPTTPTIVVGPSLCHEGQINNEPEILVGYAPGAGQSVGAGGQIKVWVNDEGAPFIAPNEQVDPTTGQIISQGDRNAKAQDGYLWEPALYIAPQTAESGGTPHFPTIIKGDYSNIPPKKGAGTKGAPYDPPPPGTNKSETYMAEFIWDVNSLGLSPGTYQAEFVIHDGDDDRGVGCISITIQ